MKLASSWAKIKSIYAGEKANEVPVSETVPSRRCSKGGRRSGTVAYACSITSEWVIQFAADIAITPGTPRPHVMGLCPQHKVCRVRV